MPVKESRGSLWALRERYLWLWRQLQRLDQKLRSSDRHDDEPLRLELFSQRVKRQLKRYWP